MAQDSMSTSNWQEVEGCRWLPILSLGSCWLGKWNSSSSGYTLIVTDGVYIWGEQRSSDYIKSKSEEWTGCIEAEGEKLSSLVLSQLKEQPTELKLVREDFHNKLTIELSATLGLLPYNWIFYLYPLSNDLVKHHWTLPLAATFEFMHIRIQKLEEDLSKKQRQLDDLLPSQIQSKKNTDVLVSNILDASLSHVLTQGTGKILSSHLSTTATVLPLLSSKRSLDGQESVSKTKTSHISHNRPKLKKPSRGLLPADEHTIIQAESDEIARREEIKALSQNPAPSIKKKKKLNI